MLGKFDSFYNYKITKIQTLIGTHYEFYKKLDILNYVAKLLKKNKFLFDIIKNISNQSYYY